MQVSACALFCNQNRVLDLFLNWVRRSAVDGQKTLHAQLDTLRRSQLFPDENGRRCPAETSRTSQNIVSNQDRASLSPVPFSTGLIPLHRERTPLLGEGFPGNVSSFSDALTSHHHRRHISNEGMPLPQYTSDASESMALGERSPTFNLSSQMSDHSAVRGFPFIKSLSCLTLHSPATNDSCQRFTLDLALIDFLRAERGKTSESSEAGQGRAQIGCCKEGTASCN